MPPRIGLIHAMAGSMVMLDLISVRQLLTDGLYYNQRFEAHNVWELDVSLNAVGFGLTWHRHCRRRASPHTQMTGEPGCWMD